MSGLPPFTLDDVEEVESHVEGFVRPLHRRGAADAAARRTRVHCVRWLPLNAVVLMKEVHLWEEDTVTCDVHTIAARIAQLQSSVEATGVSSFFVRYLALHIDTSHHYQWLLSLCGPSLHDLMAADTAAPVFTEAHCRHLLRCVLLALDHLHGVCGSVHGDVSLANILTSATQLESLSDAMLGDLESISPIGAVPCASGTTALYTAPERLEDGAIPLCPSDDVWAFGVMAYQLLTHQAQGHPWLNWYADASHPQENYWQFLNAMSALRDTPSLTYLQESALAACFPAAVPVVAACLSWQSCERPTAEVLLRHPWFAF